MEPATSPAMIAAHKVRWPAVRLASRAPFRRRRHRIPRSEWDARFRSPGPVIGSRRNSSRWVQSARPGRV